MKSTLYNNPKLYHLQYLDLTKDLRFYHQLAIQSGGPVLELALGTGRITKGILEKGIPVVGIESSEAMIKEAAEYLKEHSGLLNLLNIDFKNFKLETKFPLIICGFNSLQHIDTLEELICFFQNVREHLVPDGRFAFDLIHPDKEQLHSHKEPVMRERYYDEQARCTCEIWETSEFDEKTNIKTHFWRYRWENGKESSETMSQRFFTTVELHRAIKTSGLTVEKYYGDFAKNAFHPLSTKHVFVCKHS